MVSRLLERTRKRKPNTDGNVCSRNPLILPLLLSIAFNVASFRGSPDAAKLTIGALQESLQGWEVDFQTNTNSPPVVVCHSSKNNGTSKNNDTACNVEEAASINNGIEIRLLDENYDENLNRAQKIYDTFIAGHYVRPNKGKCNNPNIETRKGLTSSIEFVGCCGLGHRLGRMAGAAHIAHDFMSPFFGYWGCCDDTVSVFHHLFGTKPMIVGPILERKNTSLNHHLQFVVETPGMTIIKHRSRGKHLCPTRPEKIDSDYKFYTELRDHYQKKVNVDAFVNENFKGKTAIGIHIRGGNGETGDFKNKGRHIDDEKEFVEKLSKNIKDLVTKKLHQGSDPPVLFIATDTHSYVGHLRAALVDTMPVRDMPQVRKAPGEGVFFGEKRNVMKHGSTCLEGWDGAVQDMILLSHADILLIPKSSSFSQTMPASLVMGRPDRIPEPFCELNDLSTAWKCFDNITDWSCNTLAMTNVMFDASKDHRPML